MRAIVKFQKTGPARFISHLDLMRAMQRALRRAGMPVAYSQGFNPHMQLSFATALSLGAQSLYEIMDVKLEAVAPVDGFAAGLKQTLPEGIQIVDVRFVGDSFPSPMAICERASYLVQVDADLTGAMGEFMAKPQCIVQKTGKKGVRDVDIRPMVFELAMAQEHVVRMTLAHGSAMTLSPDLLMQALGAPEGYQIMRTGLYALICGKAVGLFELKEEA